MGVAVTADQVHALAPDAAAASAGKKLGVPGPWRNRGQSERAIWGECQGSAVYQTQVSVLDFGSKCTCPSRRFPCKHALGLLFLAAQDAKGFPERSEPEWVIGWLEKRETAQARKRERAAHPEKPVDEAAQAARRAQRHSNVQAGLEQLEAWMEDLVRQGLARVQGEPFTFWDAQARRLVDAQAPGLASRIRGAGSRVGTGAAWAERLLEDLGQLAVVSQAWQRLDSLSPELGADLRRVVGVTLDQAEVVAHGDIVEDDWTVTSVTVDDDERLRVQRAWLAGEHGRAALVLQFAVGAATFAEALASGTRFRARLAFWPSASPQRALIAERLGPAIPTGKLPWSTDIPAALEAFAGQLARSPWTDRALFLLAEVTPSGDQPGLIGDSTGQALPLRGAGHELALAVSGGAPMHVAGEWDGFGLALQSLWVDGACVPVRSGP